MQGRKTAYAAAAVVLLGVTHLPTSAASGEITPPAVVRIGEWFLDDALDGGKAATSFRYGYASDHPLFGDWDRDGSPTPGIVRDGVWHLRNTNTAGTADLTFRYGRPGDIPIVGDWDGNGTDTIGIVRDAIWHLRNTNTPGAADLTFHYGISGDIPIVGDWDGNGTDTIGIVRDAIWHLRNTNTPGAADLTFRYGRPGDIPIVGDWDGNGTDTIGIVRDAIWHVRNTNDGGSADHTFAYGTTTDWKTVQGGSASPFQTILGRFNPAAALGHATQLANAGPRPAGSSGDTAARRWMIDRLREAGWHVAEQPVALPQGGWTANIIATLPNSTNTGRHVVIGAHLDTVAGSPGANDNASGIGVLIALAHELADEAGRLPVDVVLVAFGAEEYQPSDPREHHVGSEKYASTHGGDVVGMISVDMIGNGDQLCICWLDHGPRTMADRLSASASQLGIGTTYVYSVPDWSDHGPFARRGIPAAFLWTGRDANYHSPGDTAEHLRIGDIDRAGRLVLHFVRTLRPGDADGLDRP